MTTKITDIINNEEISYSLEVTPDIQEKELETMDLEPSFYSITWHAHVHGCKDLEIAPLKLAKYLRSKNKIVLLHISCCHMKKTYLEDLLMLLKDVGICNLLIILGENYNSENSDFGRSQDMITYIRQRTGSYFCIGVAGFPDCEGNILHLKEKVSCGVDFILTQAFFEIDTFKKFVVKCKEADINVPIIPGIFPFETRKELETFVKLCKVHVTEDLFQKLSNESRNEIVSKLVKKITTETNIKHLHFFTMNKMTKITILIQNILISQ